MKRWTILFAVAAVAYTSFARGDSIVVEGKRYDDVFVREGGSFYYVRIPATGATVLADKDTVEPGTLHIEADAAKRDALKEQWYAASMLNAALAPPPASNVVFCALTESPCVKTSGLGWRNAVFSPAKAH